MSPKTTNMIEGGKRLGHVKLLLSQAVKAGVTPLEIDSLADKLIKDFGDKPGFKMVDGYRFATCINVNAGIVHGIPTSKPFQEGDVVKVDVGLYHNGFHLDTSTTVYIPPRDAKVQNFLEISQKALESAIFQATAGNSVYDLGLAMQTVVEAGGYNVIRDLTGHGVGRELHMKPYIPCYAEPGTKRDILSVDQTIAIEIMSAMGNYSLVEDPDGWTLSTQDGSITAMYEETVCITNGEPLILTQIN